MKTILATGGLGFIGSHTCLLLLQKGFKLVVIDSLINSSKDTIDKLKKLTGNAVEFEKNFVFRKGDIKDKKFLENVFNEAFVNQSPIDAVIHFAGLKSVNDSIKKPIEYWDNNVIGTVNLLDVMNKNNCKNIVFSSSATIYQPKLNELINEEDDLGPINPYGQTKLVIEKLLKDIYLSKLNTWKIISLRYFNPVGAHYSGILGENPKGTPNNLFPLILKVASGASKMLEVFGKDWPTIDGTCVRDYIHVMDLSEAHLASLDYLFRSSPQNISLNIGTGKGKSVLEVIDTFKKVNNCKLPFEFTHRRKGDSSFVVADNSLALKTINWNPKKNLEDMCKDSWNFMRKNSIS